MLTAQNGINAQFFADNKQAKHQARIQSLWALKKKWMRKNPMSTRPIVVPLGGSVRVSTYQPMTSRLPVRVTGSPGRHVLGSLAHSNPTSKTERPGTGQTEEEHHTHIGYRLQATTKIHAPDLIESLGSPPGRGKEKAKEGSDVNCQEVRREETKIIEQNGG